MINPAPINVHINVFEGPMDLLLHLIKKDNLDICINVLAITKNSPATSKFSSFITFK